LYNNQSGSQYFNSNNLTTNSLIIPNNNGLSSSSSSNQAHFQANANNPNNNTTLSSSASSNSYASNEFKDKDTLLSREIRFECMKILKSFVNTSYGIKCVLETKQSIMAIATAIDCNDAQSMNVACQLLAVLAVLE
jgi:hypothetical protein